MTDSPFGKIAAVPMDIWNREVLRGRLAGNLSPTWSPMAQEATCGDLSRRLLWRQDWSGLVVCEISFRQCDLRDVKFTNAQLDHVDFSGAVLFACDFTNCSGSALNFSGARLYSCNFTGAAIESARWRRAVLCYQTLNTLPSPQPLVVRQRLNFARWLRLALGEPYSWVRRPIVTLYLRFRKH